MSTPSLTVLSYQLNPSPAALMASPATPATQGYNQSVLTLTASNATHEPVSLKFLRLDVPLGSGATDLLDLLTLPALQQAVAVTADPAWTLDPDGVSVWTDANAQVWGSYLFHPSGEGTLPVNNSWEFSWQGVPPLWGLPINSVPGGPVACQVVEDVVGSPQPVTQPLPLNKSPAGWFEPTFSALPTQLASSGDTALLSWNGPAGASYVLSGLGPGAPNPLPNAGAYHSGPLTQDTDFTLVVDYAPAQGPHQHASPQQLVRMPAEKPIVTSFACETTQTESGLKLLLSWDVSLADQLSITGNPDNLTRKGSWAIFPTAQVPALSRYELTATNNFGSVTARLTANWTPVGPVQVDQGSPIVAITPDGTQALVANHDSSAVTVLTRRGQGKWYATGSPIPVAQYITGIAITPDGTQALVASRGEVGTLTVLIPGAGGQWVVAGSPMPVAGELASIAITPDGTQALVSDGSANTVSVLARGTGGQWAVVGSPLAVAPHPVAIAIAPDGIHALVMTFHPAMNVLVLGADGQWAVADTLAIGGSDMWCTGIAITPDGTQALVVNDTGSVTVLALGAGDSWATVSSVVPATLGVLGIAITPDGTQALLGSRLYTAMTVLTLGTGGQWAVTASEVPMGSGMTCIATTPDGTQALVPGNDGIVIQQLSSHFSLAL